MKKLDKFLIIIIGLIMCFAFIWLRFIRERLPKDIPFNLSILGFFVLLYICSIYGYILYSSLTKYHNTNAIVLYLLNLLYKPLIAFDNFIKDFPVIKDRYLRFMLFLAYKLHYAFIDTSTFYFIFAIFPRLLLVSTLAIDTFYFHQLYYIYNILLISILLFLHKYIIYSFKHVKEFLTVQKEPYVSDISMEYIHYIYLEIYGEEDEDDEDVDEQDKGWIPPTMSIPLRRFIELQTNTIVYENKRYDYMTIHSELAWEEIRIKYNLASTNDISMLMIRQEKNETKLKINNIENIIQLSIIIEYYNMSNTTNERYKTMKKLIFTNYLLCWSYILTMSIHTLPPDFIMLLSNVISGVITIGIMSVSYVYCYLIIKLEVQQKENSKEKENNNNEK